MLARGGLRSTKSREPPRAAMPQRVGPAAAVAFSWGLLVFGVCGFGGLWLRDFGIWGFGVYGFGTVSVFQKGVVRWSGVLYDQGQGLAHG